MAIRPGGLSGTAQINSGMYRVGIGKRLSCKTFNDMICEKLTFWAGRQPLSANVGQWVMRSLGSTVLQGGEQVTIAVNPQRITSLLLPSFLLSLRGYFAQIGGYSAMNV